MAAEDEGVAVDLSDDAAAASTDVSKDTFGFGVFAERFEVEVVDRWGLGFV